MGSERARKHPEALDSPAGASIIHELATEGARATRIGVSASHPRDPHRSTSLLVACAARADLALTRGSSAGVTTARSRSRRC